MNHYPIRHESSDPDSFYRQELIDRVVTAIECCAQRGWTPADLRHEFTAVIEPILFEALPEIAYSCPAEMYALWIQDTQPQRRKAPTIKQLENMLRRLPHLTPLSDWSSLSQENTLEPYDLDIFTPEQSKAHHRITALLKKAESTLFPAEADALILKAETLRQQYRIESLLLDSSAGEPPQQGTEIISARVYIQGPWVRHQFRLLSSIARVHSCETLLITKSGITTVFGVRDDVAHIVDLFPSLNRQRGHFMLSSPGAQEAQMNGQASSYRRSFMLSYASRISELLQQAKHDALQDLEEFAPLAHNTIVPVIQQRSEHSQVAIKKVFPNTKQMTFSSRNARGHEDGFHAANKSHLGGESTALGDSAPF